MENVKARTLSTGKPWIKGIPFIIAAKYSGTSFLFTLNFSAN